MELKTRQLQSDIELFLFDYVIDNHVFIMVADIYLICGYVMLIKLANIAIVR